MYLFPGRINFITTINTVLQSLLHVHIATTPTGDKPSECSEWQTYTVMVANILQRTGSSAACTLSQNGFYNHDMNGEKMMLQAHGVLRLEGRCTSACMYQPLTITQIINRVSPYYWILQVLDMSSNSEGSTSGNVRTYVTTFR